MKTVSESVCNKMKMLLNEDNFKGRTIGEEIASIIRDNNSGLVSGYPKGITYPGVPSVKEVADHLGLGDNLDMPCTESLYAEFVEIVTEMY